ncbi:MAG TPA: ANTAR domain-containing protein [Bryobacteraceae bacterium]|nr:ANTAR domain-containing protein [Bryobacteraceae bacterium]
MYFDASFTHFLLDFARLTYRLPPQGVLAETVESLAILLGTARLAAWLSGPAEGAMIAHSSVGQQHGGRAVQTFSSRLRVRGICYGQLQVEVLGPPREDWPSIQAGLETLALQLGLYGERCRLQQRRAALRRQVVQLRSHLAAEKAAARARGIVARDRGIGEADARRWLQAEASRRGQALRAAAERIILRETALPSVPGRPAA